MDEVHDKSSGSGRDAFIAQWLSQTPETRLIVRRAIGTSIPAQIADLEGRINQSGSELDRPQLFVHPRILLPNAVGNQWLYRPAEIIVTKVETMLFQVDFSDPKSAGPGVRRHASVVIDAIEDALVVLDYLDSIASRDPASGADPVEPARAHIRTAGRCALAFLRACWGSSESPREQIMESLELAVEPPWDDVMKQMLMIEPTPRGDEKLMAIGQGSLPFGSSGKRNVWDISVKDLHEIGRGYSEYAEVDSSDWYAVGFQATRICGGAADPLLANFAALRTIDLVRHAGRVNSELVRSVALNFWSVSAPKVTDRGFKGEGAFADWVGSGDPRKLLEAHGSLLEAVGRPLMTVALALQAIGRSSPAIDASKPPLVTELLERLAAVKGEVIFDLFVRAAHRDIRNAHGHEGVTRRPGNIIETEDGAGNVQEVDLAELEFDHEMLRSLLVGVDTGLSFFQGLVEGPERTGDLPRVRHTISSLETALLASFHALGPGVLRGIEWTDDGQTLLLRLRRGVSSNDVTSAIMNVVVGSDPETLPLAFRFEEARRGISRKTDKRKRKSGGRRHRRRR